MPTAAKSVGALLFAALAFVASRLILPLLPEGFDPGWMVEVNAALGLIFGWRIAGANAGKGWVAAFSNGLTTAVALTLFALFLNCFVLMIYDSLQKRYDGPVDAVFDVFVKMTEYGALLFAPQVLGTLLIGGVVCGYVVEVCGRTMR